MRLSLPSRSGGCSSTIRCISRRCWSAPARTWATSAPIYALAESVEFCSAVLSREMTREDPARLVNCPFIVSVYSLPDRPGTTFVAHREIPQDQVAGSATMAKVAAMLKDVAGAAANW